ncbi:MAG TPA: putative quinol monooxygenase, partial [Acidimicrobiales bacterium]|nr:putative quinol monooxygenase [Acidimicrobiales bacterium]
LGRLLPRRRACPMPRRVARSLATNGLWEDEAMTIGIVATLKVQDGKEADFEAVFRDLSAQVRANESGCLMYQLTKSRADPNTYKVLELYKDQDALTHHSGTDYFKAAGPKMGPCMAGRPEIEYLDGV